MPHNLTPITDETSPLTAKLAKARDALNVELQSLAARWTAYDTDVAKIRDADPMKLTDAQINSAHGLSAIRLVLLRDEHALRSRMAVEYLDHLRQHRVGGLAKVETELAAAADDVAGKLVTLGFEASDWTRNFAGSHPRVSALFERFKDAGAAANPNTPIPGAMANAAELKRIAGEIATAVQRAIGTEVVG